MIASVLPFGQPRQHLGHSAQDVALLFGPWDFIKDGEQVPDDVPRFSITDEGGRLARAFPEPLRDWACGWAFSLRALAAGLKWAANPAALEQSPIAAAIEPVEVDPDQIDLEHWFRLPFERLDQGLQQALRLDRAIDRSATLVQGMVYMAKGSEERLVGLLGDGLRTPITPALLSLALAHRLALMARLWFGKPLDEIYASAAAGQLDALREVIRVCPSAIGFPTLAKLFRKRLLIGDVELARAISSALANPLKEVEQFELNLNHALTMIRHSGSLSRLTDAAVQFIFLECIPPLYPVDGEDPVGSLLRKVRRFKSEGRTISPEDLSSAGD